VIPAEFGYRRPASIEEALKLLDTDPGAKVLAGGQSLLPLLKMRLASAETLVDIGRIPGLKGVRRLDDGRVAIGALTTYAELMDSPVNEYGLLRDALPNIGDVQVRNRGTIGGNLCTSDPTNHLPPLMAALGAQMTIAGPGGERTVPAADFFLGVYLTAVGVGEVLTKITVPAGRGDGFAAVTLGVDGTCIASAAASVNGSVTVALGCVDAVPVVLRPGSAEEDAVRDAVRGANLAPPADVHSSSEYRTHLAEVLAVRAVNQARS
jgi:carbon-monoxide dehydrogenase medium subunit